VLCLSFCFVSIEIHLQKNGSACFISFLIHDYHGSDHFFLEQLIRHIFIFQYHVFLVINL
jgi:hypothetical protein